ncbi:peroxiredoxin [Arthrobacter sp. APC 3897]|uniref:peroxiredoxin n=1 Tax=Arthrobacter sp. APC 3897 TaxID=3035204 RepID=UPI0025B53DCE|nr:peroxiredoxin [Arthrobacter sp. APC 3897]MDN3483116.1 peroxiredoxin [Arthrobacter sp. APC 3897]
MDLAPSPQAGGRYQAPDFELPNQFGEPVRLSDLRGQPVLVVFFPFAFSGVCTGELDELETVREDFHRGGLRILAVSCDSKYALRAYSQARSYSFDLLADFWPHGRVADAYGAFDVELGRPRRASFLIDQEGVVRTEVRSGAGTPRPLQAYRDAFRELTAA